MDERIKLITYYGDKEKTCLRSNSPGGLSFGIYLMHCSIVSCLSVVALPSVLNYWLIKWAIVLGLASAIVALGKKYIPWTIKYLGFR